MISDPVLVEVVYNALRSITERMNATLVRSAFSAIVKEMKDASCALFDREGNLIAEGANVPIHLNALGPCIKVILETYYPIDSYTPGDIVLTNDPYIGKGSYGSHHVNDLIMITPAFFRNRLIGFSVAMVHHADVGSAWSPRDTWTTEIWQEGLRIPPVKLMRGGTIDNNVMNLILSNTRVPSYMEGDLLAQVSACKLGASELQGLYEKYGVNTLQQVFSDLLNYSEMRTRNEIRQMPDGIYESEKLVLEDAYQGGPFRLALRLTVAGDTLEFDYSGTDPQICGPINAPWSATYSTTLYVVRLITDPTIPTNEGAARPIRIVAPEGTLVNCRIPAGCYQRMVVCHTLVDLILDAVVKAAPRRSMGESAGCTYDTCSAINLETHPLGGDVEHRQQWGEVVPGGVGGRFGLDGLSAMACHITNCPIPPIEQQEIEAPVLFLRRELRPDSAGPGQFRGGFGMVRSWQVLGDDARFCHTSQKSRIPPQGILGGRPGACSRWIINMGTNRERILPYAMGELMVLSKGDTVTVLTAGGGGYGDPLDRAPELVLEDVKNGLVSLDSAQKDYGVIIKKVGREYSIDYSATELERGRRKTSQNTSHDC